MKVITTLPKECAQSERKGHPSRGVQAFGTSGSHWEKKSCLGPHTKYIVTCNHKKKSHHVLSKFTISCWAAFTAVLGCRRPTGCRLDSPAENGNDTISESSRLLQNLQ